MIAIEIMRWNLSENYLQKNITDSTDKNSYQVDNMIEIFHYSEIFCMESVNEY